MATTGSVGSTKCADCTFIWLPAGCGQRKKWQWRKPLSRADRPKEVRPVTAASMKKSQGCGLASEDRPGWLRSSLHAAMLIEPRTCPRLRRCARLSGSNNAIVGRSARSSAEKFGSRSSTPSVLGLVAWTHGSSVSCRDSRHFFLGEAIEAGLGGGTGRCVTRNDLARGGERDFESSAAFGTITRRDCPAVLRHDSMGDG